MTVSLITHADCLAHRMFPQHPERPERLSSVMAHLEATGLIREMLQVTAEPATFDVLARVHAPAYLKELELLLPHEGLTPLDPDTALCPDSLRAAALAAGAAVQGVKGVLSGAYQRCFCAVRPPGHHAERSQAMGFCFYNSVAVAAAEALSHAEVNRVAILDFDVHHGNGTVDIFKDTPEVLVCSSFQHPFYPHRHHDVDRPQIVNTPLPAGTGSSGFRRALEAAWLPALERHRPDLILVSAGFDAHLEDPLGGLALTDDDFTWVTRLITDSADRYCGGRVVSTLEGGYDLDALGRSVARHVTELLTAR